MRIQSETRLTVGKLGELSFPKSYYAYVGSALNGMLARVQRHLAKVKKLHWHIDYLVEAGQVVHVFAAVTKEDRECELARKLAADLDSVSAFGSSDCSCPSRLFLHPDVAVLRASVLEAFRDLGMEDIFFLDVPQDQT